jgi:cytidylate kinase
VADGRDMGTVVFPDAQLKVFLTASTEVRAQRRLKQLMEKGYSGSLHALLLDLRERDERDRTRAVAPLKAAADAFELDASSLTIDEVAAQVLAWYRTVARDSSQN